MTEVLPRIGVIGAGYWGANLVRVCNQLGVLAAVCDADRRRLDALALPERVGRYDSAAALFASELDAIVVASPVETHAALTIQAMRHGKHVFVEKPLADSVGEAERIADVAATLGRRVFVGHLMLYHPAIIAMRGAYQAGKIGPLLHLRSRRLSLGRLRSHENVWWSFAPHDVSLMLMFFDDFPLSASASHFGSMVAGISDFAYADYEFFDGRSAHIEVSWADPNKQSRIDLFGTEGVLSFEDSRAGGMLSFTPCGGGIQEHGPATWRGEPEAIPFETREPLAEEMRAFVEVLRNGGRSPSDLEDGVRVVRALSLADAHARYAHAREPRAQAV